MHPISKTLSVVVPTLGRGKEITRLLESLEHQTFGDFEVIIVDQNKDERVTNAISSQAWSIPIQHIRAGDQRGVCRARNVGWRLAQGRIIVFPDDDCWYPQNLFAQVMQAFRLTGADVLSGRITDETGRNILGRFSQTPQKIDRDNVWTTGIEAMLFFRRNVLKSLGGFDEAIGPGSGRPWQSAEGPDIVLRALAAGFRCNYDPSLCGHHPEPNIIYPDEATRRKARAYGRGMGFVLRKHKFGMFSLAKWIARPAGGACFYALKGNWSRANYYLNMASGRFEGWRQCV